MIINKIEIKPGENTTVKIPVAKLPSATKINLIAHVYRSVNPGPTILLIGGLHGDEINGLEIVRRAVKSGRFDELKCGSVIAVPLLNVYGFINFSRDFPGGKDANRSFPGTRRGSLASRVAYIMTNEILPHADLSIDFHTGGASIYNYPQVRVNREDESSIQLAKMFSMPYLIKTGLIAKSLRKTAFKNEIPMVVFEGGESLRLDEFSIEEGIKGIDRVLYGYKMILDNPGTINSVVIEKNSWLRAPKSGIFKCLKESGAKVKKGDVLGLITDPYGFFEVNVLAKKDGIIYGHNNNPVINQGDALFHIGYLEA